MHPSPANCTRLEIDALSILVLGSRSGADVYRELCEQYDDPPSRSSVYHAIDTLGEKGLVTATDGGSDRSVTHEPTRDGEQLLRNYTSSLTVRVQTAEYSVQRENPRDR